MWRIFLRSGVWIFPTRAYGAGSLKFGAPIARNLRHTRPIPNGYWHLDEMVIVIRGQRYWLWRAVDNEGEVLDFLVQSKRNAQAALKLMRKLLKKQGWTPTRITTDKLRSYHVAIRTLGLTAQPIDDRRANNRAENSHQPVRRRERKQQRFKSPGSAQRFLNIQAAVYNPFYLQRHLCNRLTFKRFRKDAFNLWESASAPLRPNTINVTMPELLPPIRSCFPTGKARRACARSTRTRVCPLQTIWLRRRVGTLPLLLQISRVRMNSESERPSQATENISESVPTKLYSVRRKNVNCWNSG